jgi:hypothetical protein
MLLLSLPFFFAHERVPASQKVIDNHNLHDVVALEVVKNFHDRNMPDSHVDVVFAGGLLLAISLRLFVSLVLLAAPSFFVLVRNEVTFVLDQVVVVVSFELSKGCIECTLPLCFGIFVPPGSPFRFLPVCFFKEILDELVKFTGAQRPAAVNVSLLIEVLNVFVELGLGVVAEKSILIVQLDLFAAFE